MKKFLLGTAIALGLAVLLFEVSIRNAEDDYSDSGDDPED